MAKAGNHVVNVSFDDIIFTVEGEYSPSDPPYTRTSAFYIEKIYILGDPFKSDLSDVLKDTVFLYLEDIVARDLDNETVL